MGRIRPEKAVSKFGHPFTGSRIAIMATYIVGQWLLARGVRDLGSVGYKTFARHKKAAKG